MIRQYVLTVVLFTFLFPFIQIHAATPLDPGFTYQGRLEQSGTPAEGIVHLRFSLWDAEGSGVPPLGGVQIGSSQLLTDVPVQDGVFTVVLNAGGGFGPNAFNGEGRWLQIEVCGDPGCSSLSILSPRQPVTGAPYALKALSAPWSGLTDVPEGFADGIDNGAEPVWETNGASINYTAGLVGIGTATPDTKLQVNDGRIRLRESATLERWDFFYDPPSEKFYLQENAGYNHLVFTKGPQPSVGIGTDTPDGKIARLMVYSPDDVAIFWESNGDHGVVGFSGNASFAGVYGYNQIGTGVRCQGLIGVHGVTNEPGGAGVVGSSPSNLSGSVVTDSQGYADVLLPEYFGSLNRDFLYQLTVVDTEDTDQFVLAKVVKEIEENRFTIRSSEPSVKISWQVTGIRNDPYAKAHPIEVEKMKTPKERGKYLTPELFGQPKEKAIGYRPETDPLSGKISELANKEPRQ